ncbi:hypothetical protein JYU34_017037 [Plutella xylostella]|uniref:Uncharacterized protein n=1 Tax=Plutella xylostella TaxID=51655 RepID=A0ABQ7Q5H7_PLUXY|nr:hypothetical protein JYU34_017037 [Plutella xylostella]
MIVNCQCSVVLTLQVESTHYPTSNLPFPGLVLCDPHQVYGPRADTLVEIITRRGFKKESIFHFFDSILNILNPKFTADASVNNIYKLLDNAGYPLLDLLDILSKPCSVLLARCVWRSQEHNCSDMFQRVLTFRGYCCQFHIDHFRYRLLPPVPHRPLQVQAAAASSTSTTSGKTSSHSLKQMYCFPWC